MRTNLPINTKETLLPEHRLIISTTDLQGHITYCNDLFINVSGFSKEELLGQPHNIVRHPDMPPEAFRSLWANVQSGLPWEGVVKNRRKDGGFYWVYAQVVPVFQNMQIKGYLSVRKKPTREEIDQAEQLYNRVKKRTAKISPLTLPKANRGLPRRSWIAFCGLTICAALAAASHTFSWPDWSGWLLGLIAIFLGIFGFCAAKKTTKRLRVLLKNFRDIADEDLTTPIPLHGRDALGSVFNALGCMTVHMQSIMDHIHNATVSISTQIQTVEGEMRSVESHADIQKSQIEQATDAIEQSNQNIQDIVTQDSSTLDAVHAAEQCISDGKLHISDSRETLQKVIDSVMQSSDSLNKMKLSLRQISKISNLIAEITKQTNQLALNAAVEAARGHDQGFAVVAEEIRKLADNIAERTVEIARSASDMYSITDRALNAMRGAINKIQTSQVNVEESISHFEEIEEAVNNVDQSATVILDMTKTQLEMMQTVSDTLHTVEQLSEQSTDVIHTTNRITETLQQASQDLTRLVDDVKLTR